MRLAAWLLLAGQSGCSVLAQSWAFSDCAAVPDWAAGAHLCDFGDRAAAAGEAAGAPKLNPVVGNGYGGGTAGTGDLYIAGLYNGGGSSSSDLSHRAALPNFASVGVKAASGVGAALDLAGGAYVRRVTVPGALIEERFYAHRTRRHLFVHEATIWPKAAGDGDGASVCFEVQSAAGDNQCNQSTAPGGTQYECADLTLTVTAPGGDGQPAQHAGTTRETEDGSAGLQVFMASSMGFGAEECHQLPAGATNGSAPLLVAHLLVVCTAVAADDCASAEDAAAHYAAAVARPPSSLRAEHEAAWAELWDSGIEIDGGDARLQGVINASLYSLVSAVRPDWPWSVSPGGFVNTHAGHVFWDAESFSLPPLMYLHPELAKAALDYRINVTASGAAANAAARRYKGLRYGWESGHTGHELVPLGAWPEGALEDHDTAGVALAIQKLTRLLPREDAWARAPALGAAVAGITRYLVSRVSPGPCPPFGSALPAWPAWATPPSGAGCFDITHVVGPDEFACGVDGKASCTGQNVSGVNNSAYENVAVAAALAYGATEGGVASKLLGSAERARMKLVSRGLWVPFDPQRDLVLEFVGYRGTTVKQADVTLLPSMLHFNLPPVVALNNIDYYCNVTVGDTVSTTSAVKAIGLFTACADAASPVSPLHRYRAALRSRASAELARSYVEHATAPFGTFSETRNMTGAIPYLTGQGGFLQGIFGGLAGLRVQETSLRLRPMLLSEGDDGTGIRRLRLRKLRYQGYTLTVDVAPARPGPHYRCQLVEVTVVSAGPKPLFLVSGERCPGQRADGSPAEPEAAAAASQKSTRLSTRVGEGEPRVGFVLVAGEIVCLSLQQGTCE